ncbi:hypothetical protein JCM8547_004829 [Rhodosporidiobolus lusitaniae]
MKNLQHDDCALPQPLRADALCYLRTTLYVGQERIDSPEGTPANPIPLEKTSKEIADQLARSAYLALDAINGAVSLNEMCYIKLQHLNLVHCAQKYRQWQEAQRDPDSLKPPFSSTINQMTSHMQESHNGFNDVLRLALQKDRRVHAAVVENFELLVAGTQCALARAPRP